MHLSTTVDKELHALGTALVLKDAEMTQSDLISGDRLRRKQFTTLVKLRFKLILTNKGTAP